MVIGGYNVVEHAEFFPVTLIVRTTVIRNEGSASWTAISMFYDKGHEFQDALSRRLQSAGDTVFAYPHFEGKYLQRSPCGMAGGSRYGSTMMAIPGRCSTESADAPHWSSRMHKRPSFFWRFGRLLLDNFSAEA